MASLSAGRELSDAPVLGGNSEEVVDTFAWTALGVVCGLGVLLFIAQKLQARRLSKVPPSECRSGEERTPIWVLASFFVCYSLLIPGLFSVLFSYDISGMNGTVPLRHKKETMVSFVGELWVNKAYLGSVLVVLYAIVIPAVKLVMLLLSELWRRGSPEQVMRSRRCVRVLQGISKWASPDMFAYVLLLYLLRALNHPPTMLAMMELDIGFSCFSIFCVGSTVAALGLRMPPLPDGAKEAEPRCFGWMRRPAVQAGIVALLFAAFVPLLIVGLSQPSMSLKVDPNGFFEPNGPLPEMLRPIVMSLGIEEIAHAEVSIWQCMGKLAEWAGSGEANSLIGFILFAVCAVAATIVDMLLLLAAALMTLRRAARPVTPSNEASAPAGRDGAEPLLLVRIAQVLKKLSFLDVAIVGIVVVVLGGQAYRVQGLILSMEIGLVPLFLAETCHYLAYYLVAHAQPSGLDAARSIKLKEGGEPQQGQVSGAPEALAVEV